jgi:radical SAM superfamily enzyme YgiQ (UPF0313 family)
MSRKIKKIILISPKKPLQKENPKIYEMFERNKEQLKPWLAPPLNLLTIAALTPDDIEVKVIDEHFEKIDFDQECDLVGLTAMTQQAMRAYEIAAEFRKKNIPVVMGGIHVSVLPHEALQYVDTVFIGEAEELWQKYIDDLKKSQEKNIYKQETRCDLRKSPVPRYDLINFNAFKDVNNYFNNIPIQATRGCPHDCSFCVVSKFYGTKIRKKDIGQVVKEIELLQTINKDSLLLFADDNLFVDKNYAKSLLKALIPLKIKYFVQSDVKVAEDQELLDLAYRSGCQIIFMGFESLDINSLEEINKSKWKMKQLANYSKSIKKIQESGIIAFGAFVIGFNNDDLSIFKKIRDFAHLNYIPGQFTLLTPIPGSQLYDELKSDGKLYAEKFWDRCGFYNMVFKHDKMTKEEAEDSLIWLYDEVFNPESSMNRFLYMKNIYKSLPPRWI